MNKVQSGSNADFQHFSMREREQALTDFLDRFWIAQNTYKMGIHMLPIERHTGCRLSQRSVVTALSCSISSQRLAQNRHNAQSPQDRCKEHCFAYVSIAAADARVQVCHPGTGSL